MIFKKALSALLISCLLSTAFIFPGFAEAQSAGMLTLKETIAKAIAANLQLQSSQEGTRAALANKKASKTEFYPTFSAKYQYSENDESADIGGITIGLEREYSFRTSVTQPIFRGFSLVNKFEISKLGLDVAQTNEKLIRQDIIFNAQRTYFSLLQAQKLLNVADQTVTQIGAQRNVAKNFYDVGMRPLNDLLQSEVELANAEQDRIVARNNLSNAESDFNILLRRSMNTPVAIQDILAYASFEHDLAYCYSEAEKNRLEIRVADLEVEIAAKELKLARKDYYPSVDLQGSYFKSGTDWTVDGGEGVFDPSGWNILATASWNFWEWGRTTYGIKEKHSRLLQAQLRKSEILDNIHLEVKNAYLRTQEAEKAIIAIEKAIEQAKENYRINEEQYKAQMTTQTDLLIAQNLLTRTMSNYYRALYQFKISKAGLYRVMGQEVIE